MKRGWLIRGSERNLISWSKVRLESEVRDRVRL